MGYFGEMALKLNNIESAKQIGLLIVLNEVYLCLPQYN